MKILQELILNGECIVNDVAELSSLKFKLEYDLNNNAFKITANSIDQTKSPSHDYRKKAFSKLAEIFNEETSGCVSKEGNTLKVEISSMTINHHGVNWLSKQSEVAKTIELLKLQATISKSTLEKITNDLIKFLNNEAPFSSRKINLGNQFEYYFSDKFHHSYQMRLLKTYFQRLNDLLLSKFTYKPDENTGITYIENPPTLYISQLAIERLRGIYNSVNASLEKLQAPLDDPQFSLDKSQAAVQALSEKPQASLNSSVNQANTSEQSTPLSMSSTSARTIHVAPTAVIKSTPLVSIEAISSQSNRNTTIDLELLFATGELYIVYKEYKYIASYYYDLELHQINIEVKKENQTNIATDELSPRSANCQHLVEIIHNDIIHKFALPMDAEIHLDKSKNKITLKNQAVGKIFSANDSEKTANLIKTIKLLTHPDPSECNKLLIEITSNKNKYFRCMLLGDNYEITCEYGNTQFKANPGISERMSSDLSNLLRKGFTHLVSEQYPELQNKLDMKSPGKKTSDNCYAFVVDKKTCDDVLIKTYLSSQPEKLMVTAQVNLTLENAKKQLDAFVIPLKDRHLNTANLADLKQRMQNAVRCLFTKMNQNDLESICQFYEYLKTPEINKYLNAHKNPIYDSIFSKTNTNSWQEIMKLLKNHALEILKSRTAEVNETQDKIALLSKYRERQIFIDHRFNKFSNRFHNTATVNEIDKLIVSYRTTQIKVK